MLWEENVKKLQLLEQKIAFSKRKYSSMYKPPKKLFFEKALWPKISPGACYRNFTVLYYADVIAIHNNFLHKKFKYQTSICCRPVYHSFIVSVFQWNETPKIFLLFDITASFLIASCVLSTRYQMMLDCWQDNPDARPTFSSLRNTLKGMERNHVVSMTICENRTFLNW